MKLIAEHVHDLILDDVYLRVSGLGDLNRLYLKVEGFNPGGSVKMKTARGLIHSAENSGADLAGLRLIESTSGNLGISSPSSVRRRTTGSPW